MESVRSRSIPSPSYHITDFSVTDKSHKSFYCQISHSYHSIFFFFFCSQLLHALSSTTHAILTHWIQADHMSSSCHTFFRLPLISSLHHHHRSPLREDSPTRRHVCLRDRTWQLASVICDLLTFRHTQFAFNI